MRTFLPVLSIFAFALVLRLIGITWGLPNAGRWYSYHPDESLQQIVGAVGNMLQGGLNPHFFNYPSLAIYATYFFYLVQSALGLNTVTPFADYPWGQVRDIILAGRIFTALCGAGTAALVYLIAKELRPGRWAILAGVLAALAPGFLQHSHFATVDVPATFFVALCLWLTLRAKDTRGLLWAAFAAGLAAGTKYNGIIVLVAPLVALFFWPQWRELKWKRLPIALGFAVVSLVAFFITTPYALLSTEEFLGIGKFTGNGENGFLYELLVHPKQGSGDIFQETGNGWWYHFSLNMPYVFTWPFVLVGILGITFVAENRRWWPLVFFAAIYFGAIGVSQVRFMRYLLPLVPVFALTAAYVLAQLRLKNKLAAQALTGGLLLVVGFGAVDAKGPLVTKDPRDQAANYLRDKNVVFVDQPWYYSPPIQPRDFKQGASNIPVVGFDLKKVQQASPTHVVVTEYQWMEALRLRPGGPEAKFLQQLGSQSQVKSFPGFRREPLQDDPAGVHDTYEPHDYLYTHPEVRVYETGPAGPSQ